jgi:hypothetical protein
MKKIIWISLILGLAACKKDEDTSAPVVDYVRVNGVAADEHELLAGESFTVQLKLTDNEALNQVKLNVHAADDGHTHNGMGGGDDHGPNVGIWTASRILNLDGTEAVKNLTFSVPDDVAGHWHLEVLLIDEKGNEAEEYITTLHVENPDLPVITVTMLPAPTDDEVVLAPGSTLSVSALVEDADGVGEVHIAVEDEDGNEVQHFDFDGAGAISYTAGPQAIVFEDAGHFHLHIEAMDGGGMMNLVEMIIHVE